VDADRARLDELLAAAARQQTGWRWAEAHDMLRHAVRMARAAGVRDTELPMLNCRRMLAETLRELGQVEQARRLVMPLLEDCRAYAGPAHPVTVRTAAVAGAVLHDLGELAAAEQLYHRLVDTRQAGDGAAARAVMLARVNLALLHRDRGNLSGALGLLCAVYAEFRREYGNDDLDTIRVSVELADLYRRCGDAGNARRLLTVAHAAARGMFGDRHRLTSVVEAELRAIERQWPADPEPPPRPPAGETALARRPPAPPPVSRRGQPAAPPWSAPRVRAAVLAGVAALLAAGRRVLHSRRAG
jgi:Tetratricopeptide repeat